MEKIMENNMQTWFIRGASRVFLSLPGKSMKHGIPEVCEPGDT